MIMGELGLGLVRAELRELELVGRYWEYGRFVFKGNHIFQVGDVDHLDEYSNGDSSWFWFYQFSMIKAGNMLRRPFCVMSILKTTS